MKLFAIMMVSIVGICLAGFRAEPEPIIQVETRTVEVERKKANIRELIKSIPPRYGIPPEVMAVIWSKEDDGRGRAAVRFEEANDEWLARAKAITKDPEQQQMYRRSYGPMQVAGWHAPRYGLTWVDLTDEETNIEVGCAVFAEAWQAAKKVNTNPERALREAFRRYNGSQKYADDAMQRLSSALITHYLKP